MYILYATQLSKGIRILAEDPKGAMEQSGATNKNGKLYNIVLLQSEIYNTNQPIAS